MLLALFSTPKTGLRSSRLKKFHLNALPSPMQIFSVPTSLPNFQVTRPSPFLLFLSLSRILRPLNYFFSIPANQKWIDSWQNLLSCSWFWFNVVGFQNDSDSFNPHFQASSSVPQSLNLQPLLLQKTLKNGTFPPLSLITLSVIFSRRELSKRGGARAFYSFYNSGNSKRDNVAALPYYLYEKRGGGRAFNHNADLYYRYW